MKNKFIVVYEGKDWINVSDDIENGLTEIQYNDLQEYLLLKYGNLEMLYIKPKKIMIVNMVGFIKLSSIYIEILPKISISNNIQNSRLRLIEMLTKCKKIPIIYDFIQQENINRISIIEYIQMIFLDELGIQMNKGIYKEYVRNLENCSTVKGKICIGKHINYNYFNKDKVFCEFDDFIEDNNLNRILKAAILKILTSNYNINSMKLNRFLFYFSGVSNEKNIDNILHTIKLNRQNQRYEKSLLLAKLILDNSISKNNIGKQDGFSMLFEINKLFEEYIGILCKSLSFKNRIKCFLQDKRNYLLKNKDRKYINLKPDIVFEKEEKILIIDTKWKAIINHERLNYNISDIYQMYAYVTRYENAIKCILLYPKININFNNEEYNLFEPHINSIELRDVRLDKEKNTIDDLTEIILENFNSI